jgi:hypothetical protein
MHINRTRYLLKLFQEGGGETGGEGEFKYNIFDLL